ncbi:MAG: (2Fe-2S)-binding protein [Chlorobiales bacterium]|nr:(2Fe-2S)-binding protein [Chlorobiales bacterium]
MPKVEINGQQATAIVEETLLAVARKEKHHIGYACGGNGLCQTCDVVVHEGMDSLSEVNDVERAWNTEKKLREGHRLACQAQVMREGTVKLVTRPEKTKLMFDKAFGPEASSEPIGARMGNAGALVAFIGIETVEHVLAMPFVLVNTVQRMMDGRLTAQASDDVTEAWKERWPDIQEAASKSTFGLTGAMSPLVGMITPLFQNIIGMVSSLFGGRKASEGTEGNTESKSEGISFQNVPIQLVKRA